MATTVEPRPRIITNPVRKSINRSPDPAARPDPPDTRETITDVRLRLDSLVHVSALLGLVSYITGLLTVNAYLYGIGASDFALVRPRYIFTGVLVNVVQLSMFLATFVVLSIWLRVFRIRHRVVKYVLVLVSALVLILPLYWGFRNLYEFLSLVFSGGLRYAYGNWDPGRASLYLLWVSVASTAWGLLALGNPSRVLPFLHKPVARLGSQSGITGTTVVRAIATMLLLATFVTNAIVCGIVFYERVPEQFGGGRPRLVRFLIDADASERARDLGMQLVPETTLTGPQSLIWESEDVYFVGYRYEGSGRRYIVQISKDIVTAVVYDDQRLVWSDYAPQAQPGNSPAATPGASP
jgi:hypothetical protein